MSLDIYFLVPTKRTCSSKN